MASHAFKLQPMPARLTTFTLLIKVQHYSPSIEDTIKPSFPAQDYLPVHHVYQTFGIIRNNSLLESERTRTEL